MRAHITLYLFCKQILGVDAVGDVAEERRDAADLLFFNLLLVFSSGRLDVVSHADEASLSPKPGVPKLRSVDPLSCSAKPSQVQMIRRCSRQAGKQS